MWYLQAVTMPNAQKPDARHSPRTGATASYEDGTAYVLAVAGAIVRRRWVDALARLDVTPTQFKLIMSLQTAGSLGQRELAELVGIDPRNCSPVVDALVDRKLLARETDSTDRRKRVLRLTEDGARLADDLHAANAQTETGLRDQLGPREYESLREKLLPVLQADDAPPPA